MSGVVIMGLRGRRRNDRGHQPEGDVIARVSLSRGYVARLAADCDLAGMWNGPGCAVAGLPYGGTLDDPHLLDDMLQGHAGADIVMTVDESLCRRIMQVADQGEAYIAIGDAEGADRISGVLGDVLDALLVRGMDIRLMAREIGWPDADWVSASFIHPISQCFPGADPVLLHTHTVIAGVAATMTLAG
jgi:hypothetical protein